MNFVVDPAKLVARKKIVPRSARSIAVVQRLSTGKMPPAGEQPRPSEADVALIKSGSR